MSTTTSLRLPNLPPNKSSALSGASKPTDWRRLSLALLFVALTLGTVYSVVANTYLDTSNPLLAHLPHPSHDKSYFARKSNVWNQWFVKRAWGWTCAISFALAVTGRSATGSQTPRTTRIWLWRITLATLVWAAFTSWFFGPPLFDRVGTATGAECVIVVPFPTDTPNHSANPGVDGLIGGRENGVLLSVPIEYCHTRTTISADTHANLFTNSPSQLLGTHTSSGFKGDVVENLEETWKAAVKSWKGGRARLYKGHDVSGHIFLLTMCILFLTDQVADVLYPFQGATANVMRKVRGPETWTLRATLALLGLWWWMAIMTSVYFHTPQEKLSGFLIGVAGYFLTRIPLPLREPPKIGVPIPDEKLRSDAMHLD